MEMYHTVFNICIVLPKNMSYWLCVIVCRCTCVPTSQQLLDLSAGLCGGELVHDVQRGLTQSVSHSCTDAALEGGGGEMKKIQIQNYESEDIDIFGPFGTLWFLCVSLK